MDIFVIMYCTEWIVLRYGKLKMFEKHKCPTCDKTMRHSNIEDDKYVCDNCNEVFSEKALKKLWLGKWL